MKPVNDNDNFAAHRLAYRVSVEILINYVIYIHFRDT